MPVRPRRLPWALSGSRARSLIASRRRCRMTAEHDGRDIARFIWDQHTEIRQLLTDVASHQGGARRDAFEDLVRLLAVHETAEEEVMYPVVREARGGDAVAEARITEESDAKQMLAGVEHAGVDSDEFAPRFAVMR